MSSNPESDRAPGASILRGPALIVLSLLGIGVLTTLVVAGFAIHEAQERSSLRRFAYKHASKEAHEDIQEECNELLGRVHRLGEQYLLHDGGSWSGGSGDRGLRGAWIETQVIMNDDHRVVAVIALYLTLDGTGSSPHRTQEVYLWNPDATIDPFFEQLRPNLELWGPIQQIDARDLDDLEERLSIQAKAFRDAL